MAKRTKQIGILTGGGDCPGLNAAIRAVVQKAEGLGYEVHGFYDGWAGILKRKSKRLTKKDVAGILCQGGTILKTSRTNPFVDASTAKKFRQSLKTLKLHALIAIGGEDTLGVAARLAREGFPVIGIPKTIDNDLMGTELTIGFNTAVSVASDAIDRLQTTAESHNRVMVVEVMGRHSGWIAAHAGIAAGADDILIPECPVDLKKVCAKIRDGHHRHKNSSIIVVAEGVRLKQGSKHEWVLASQAKDAFGHVKLGGIGDALAKAIEAETGFECRAVVLGYLQRGGDPTPDDRLLATEFGSRAVDLVTRQRWGRLVALQKGRVTDVSLSVVTKGIKKVDRKLLQLMGTR